MSAFARDHTVTDSELNGFVGVGVGKDYNRGAERTSVDVKLSPFSHEFQEILRYRGQQRPSRCKEATHAWLDS